MWKRSEGCWKAPPPADYHPLLTSGIFSALQRAARANCQNVNPPYSSDKLYLHLCYRERTSGASAPRFPQFTCQSKSVGANVSCFCYRLFLIQVFFFFFFSLSVFFYSLVLSSTGAREGRKFLQPHIFLKSPGRSRPARLHPVPSYLFNVAPWLVLHLYFTGKKYPNIINMSYFIICLAE